MSIKGFLFAALGLIIFGGLTMMWVGHDMHQISVQEQAERTAECKAVANGGALPSDVRAAEDAALGSDGTKPSPTEKFTASCTKLGIPVETAADPANGPGALDAAPDDDRISTSGPDVAAETAVAPLATPDASTDPAMSAPPATDPAATSAPTSNEVQPATTTAPAAADPAAANPAAVDPAAAGTGDPAAATEPAATSPTS